MYLLKIFINSPYSKQQGKKESLSRIAPEPFENRNRSLLLFVIIVSSGKNAVQYQLSAE